MWMTQAVAGKMAAGVPGSWTGFSEEELSRIRRQEVNTEHNGSSDVNVKSASLKRNRNKKRPSSSSSHRVVSSQTNVFEVDNPNQLLGPASVCLSQTSQANRLKTSHVVGLNSSPVCLRINEEGQVLEVLDHNVGNCESKNEKNVESKDQSSLSFECNSADKNVATNELANLEKYEQRQKLMEEQNRHRRALLSRALVERRKKTQAETEKLGHIQQELAKLDSLVSGDVAILRKHIEQASLEFCDAQKRYRKAEEEFVEAKIELFKKMEKKEQLTEHLCTIIEHNETRKAQKLAELMKELEMESFIDEFQDEGIVPFLTQLCALNDNSYNSCSTIKDPNAHKSLPESDFKDGDLGSTETTNELYNANGNPVLNEITTKSDTNLKAIITDDVDKEKDGGDENKTTQEA